MENINYHDPSYSPNEAAEASNIPECGACYDNGYIDEDETVFCDCPEGERENDLMAEVEAEMRAEEHSERMATDYAYAVDSQGGDYEGGLFEDDGDALASAGMGTDEDYGAW